MRFLLYYPKFLCWVVFVLMSHVITSAETAKTKCIVGKGHLMCWSDNRAWTKKEALADNQQETLKFWWTPQERCKQQSHRNMKKSTNTSQLTKITSNNGSQINQLFKNASNCFIWCISISQICLSIHSNVNLHWFYFFCLSPLTYCSVVI